MMKVTGSEMSLLPDKVGYSSGGGMIFYIL